MDATAAATGGWREAPLATVRTYHYDAPRVYHYQPNLLQQPQPVAPYVYGYASQNPNPNQPAFATAPATTGMEAFVLQFPPQAVAGSLRGVHPSPYGSLLSNSRNLVVAIQAQANPTHQLNRVAHPPMKRVKKGAKKVAKVVQSILQCDVCKIQCNTLEVLNIHRQGKKHKKNLQKLQESITPKPPKPPTSTAQNRQAPGEEKGKTSSEGIGKAIEDLEVKKQKVLQAGADAGEVRVCTICNVVVNSRLVFNYHIEGQKHAAMVKKPPTSTAQNRQAPGEEKGKTSSEGIGKAIEDLEVKKQKVLQAGADAGEVRVCTICNVVVNSQLVFNYHIEGQKHAAMVKKSQAGSVNSIR